MNAFPNIRQHLPSLVVAVAMVSFVVPAVADDLKFKLSGDMEVPPVATEAVGDAAIRIKPDMSVSGKLTTRGMVGTMAHIHMGGAGINGPVVITLSRSGDQLWTVPEDSKLGAAEYKAYLAGELYVNVHSADHRSGEIRGQLVPPAADTKYSY